MRAALHVACACAVSHQRQRAVCNRTVSRRGGARAHGSRGSWRLWACALSRDVRGKRTRAAMLYEAGERMRDLVPYGNPCTCLALSAFALCFTAVRWHMRSTSHVRMRKVSHRFLPLGVCACAVWPVLAGLCTRVLLRTERQLLVVGLRGCCSSISSVGKAIIRQAWLSCGISLRFAKDY